MAWLGAGMGEGIRPAAALPPTSARFARADIRARRRDVSDIWRSASGGLRRRRPRRRAVERRQRRLCALAERDGSMKTRSVERREKSVDRGEARVEDARRHPEPDAQMPLRPEVRAGHDHRAPLLDEPVDERDRVDRELVAEEADRSRRRGRPVELARMRRGPVLERGPALVEQETRAFEEVAPPLERDLGEDLADRGRGDRRVVLQLERRCDALARAHDPADAQTRQPVHLREASGDDDALATTGEARALVARALGSAIDLVGEDPGAVTLGDAYDRGDLTRGEDLRGRVVRCADADHSRALVHRRPERVEVDRPAALLAEPDLANARAEPGRDAVDLHVVRHDDDDLVT